MKPDHNISTRKLHTSKLTFQPVPRGIWRRAVPALLALAFIAITITGNWGKARVTAAGTANTIFALSTTNQLLRFSAGSPGTLVGAAVAVTGLVAGDALVGIDFRPATGQLYGLGVNGATAHLYTIATATGAATQIGGNIALPQSAGVAAGANYGFDFNPTVDRIRVVADSRDNFRLNPDTGGVAGADTALTAGSVIVGAAYDRNAAGLVQTTLFGIDSNTDQLVTIGGVNGVPSPNTGAVTVVGNLGVNTNTEVGFDIAGDTAGSAYASLQVGGVSGFYTVNLGSGAVTLVGAIAGGLPIRDIAVAPGGVLRFAAPTYTVAETANLANIVVTRTGGAFGAASVTVTTSNGTATAGQDYTAVTATLNFADGVTTQNFDIPILDDALIEGNETVILTFSNYTGCGLASGPGLLTITDNEDGLCNLWAVDANNNLIRFTADVPGLNITSVPITGLAPGELIAGIDFRPATGQLFALAVSPVGGRIYTLNLGTAAATVIGGAGFTLPQSAGVGAGASYGFDFNPTVDRIRVVADSGDNFRINPDTGGIAGADTALTAGSVIAGAAYDRNYVFAGQVGTNTTLYAIDANTDQLVTIGGINSTPSPNTGAVTVVGPLGVNTSTVVGFDIINGAEGTAFAVLTVAGQQALYTINLATGAATPVGRVNNPVPIVAFSAATAGTVQLSTSLYTVSEAAGAATITVTRTGGACGSIQVTATTSDGTATTAAAGVDPADYVATAVTLNFPEGVTSRTFTIPIINDNVDEPDQTVNITLSANIGGRITSPSAAVLTIADDDTAAVSINDISVAEGNVGTSNAVFTISLSNPSTAPISVTYTTADGTAAAGSDYIATTNTVTFAAGVTSLTIPIPIIGDTNFEPDEDFFINLSNNPAILKGQGRAVIVNDDVNQGGAPGLAVLPENSVVNDQKAGSILIYPIYTSSASGGPNQNTRFSITNTDTARPVSVHLFLVDGTSCAVSDTFICLTQTQTSAFLASDLDPGQTGFMIAVAVNNNGCPIIFNALIGDEYVKFSSGHEANLGAEAVAGLAGLVNSPVCNPDTPSVVLPFNNVVYQPLPRVLAADNIPDRASGNDTLLILDRIGGSLLTGASSLSAIFGILFDDQETAASFGFTASGCQFRSSLSNNFPRVTPRFEQLIPANRSGWLKLSADADSAIIGATINFNPNAASSSNAFNQGHNLHILRVTTNATLTMPVFPPAC